ncbi:MAG: hypothetical protein HY006_00870 [Candidatus Sungbacteria bacterium]|nr:hypothetical protein [Candidatus Sungbacteria bacterium]
MNHFKKTESTPVSDPSPDNSLAGEIPTEGSQDEAREEGPATEQREPNPYAPVLLDIYLLTQESKLPDVDKADIDQYYRTRWESGLQKIRQQEALLEQGLASKERFTDVLDELAELASNEIPHEEPVGLEAASFAGRLIEKHIDRIRAIIQEGVTRDESADHADIGAAIRAMSSLIKAGGDHFEELGDLYYVGMDVLTDNLQSIENGIFAGLDHDPFDCGSKLANYAQALKPLFVQGYIDPAIRRRVAHITASVVVHQQKVFCGTAASVVEETANIIVDRLRYRNMGPLDASIPSELFLQEVLEGYSVSPDDFHRAWQRSIHNETSVDFHQIVKRNLESMRNIEYKYRSEDGPVSPGGNAVKYLNENFGIYDFARYPESLLIRQYEAEHRTDEIALPYGLVINARDDHNGGLYDDYWLFKDLRNKLEKRDQPWLLRVIEVDNKREMGRRALQFLKKYGPAKFGILGGHGTAKTIRLGRWEGAHVLHMDDLIGRGIQRGAKMLFEEHAPIVLNSCNTGTPEGIGQKMFETSGLTFIGPDKPTSLRSIEI